MPFYLSGEDIEGDWKDYALKDLDCAPLIEMWFDPDRSEENWQKIRDNYEESQWRRSRLRFENVLSQLGTGFLLDSTESFFDGLEERFLSVVVDRKTTLS